MRVDVDTHMASPPRPVEERVWPAVPYLLPASAAPVQLPDFVTSELAKEQEEDRNTNHPGGRTGSWSGSAIVGES